MANREYEPVPPLPNELPPELAAFLIDRPYACVTQATDRGTVLVVKAPSRELQTLPGTIPIHIRHELYRHPQAPVIRMVTTIFDRPRNPLALETFINVEDPQQRADYEALTHQPELHLLFYDEGLRHRLTKSVANAAQDVIAEVLAQADSLYAGEPPRV